MSDRPVGAASVPGNAREMIAADPTDRLVRQRSHS